MAGPVVRVVGEVDRDEEDQPRDRGSRRDREHVKALVDQRVAGDLERGADEADGLLSNPTAQAADRVVERVDLLTPLAGDEQLQRDQQEEEGDREGDGARVHDRGRV